MPAPSNSTATAESPTGAVRARSARAATRVSAMDSASHPLDLRLSANPLRGVEIPPNACVVAHQRRGTVAELLGDVRWRLALVYEEGREARSQVARSHAERA